MRVEAWLFGLALPEPLLGRLEALLSPAERARADAMAVADVRARFIARRGQLRLILARHLAAPPASLRLEAEPYGKPYLVGCPAVRFNASSSGDLGLCAVTRDAAIGCDIALREDRLASMEVADRFFSRTERETLRALAPARRVGAFFDVWSRKEAFVKALGAGLSLPLSDFDVTVRPEDRPGLSRVGPGWAMAAFMPQPRYHAAIVIRSPTLELHVNRFLAERAAW